MMDYLPRFLARKFHNLIDVSFGLILFWLILFIVIIFSISNAFPNFFYLVIPVVSAGMVAFAGSMSAKFYRRNHKPFISSDPAIVKVTASSAFNRLSIWASIVVEILFSLLVHVMIFQALFVLIAPIVLFVSEWETLNGY
ncbi:hypothetical protein RN22_14565 [Grimontia sp. AD028]|uniref:hypothetical protein n=1 Tax=Grimontia sp. AD028 TaxID=1581149 RepID=UPI00061B23CE|nr:hypothetical protein [Grimontia sp. AD028]KKD59667.1 hypothetical protein RN22_14565 [Grimontia sp. AD028]